ncbi:Cytochrome c [Polystyrenella longa]|uniref:Cytochrome c n=1 Tax=Polystyrenella longa TaxID=2528007 RepID=A0A518CHW4_9PLAN|nr:c-type cytochrome [Polystyrenella longa]QDU78764.1 Cytochrome c [Polystyrenella longa]
MSLRWLSIPCLVLTLCLSWSASPLQAQDNYNASWIWQNGVKAWEDAPSGSVWFRQVVRSGGPSTGAMRLVSSDPFQVWVNGQEVGKGNGKELYRYSLNGIVGRGPNVIAVRVDHGEGQAGLFVDGEVRDQGGTSFPFDSNGDWLATSTKPDASWLTDDFNSEGWKKVTVSGAHPDSPWNELELKDSYLDRYALAPGYKIERIGEPELVGSLIAMTWGNNGRVIASQEGGPIVTITDENNDGIYDKTITYSDQMKNCQGLCTVLNDLYAVGQGPEGVGVYLLPDENNDGVADSIKLIGKNKSGVGEHGPHDVVWGPDGWLYHNMGNHAWMDAEMQPNSPAKHTYEGVLLQPSFKDAGGHASKITEPGGTIWRFTPDGSEWWRETSGFRNEYDIAFNKFGDLFTFDSDMEWDVGMPWYRPVRVNHCVPGAEFGWRTGSTKWPEYFLDSLPTTVDIGRGSPTGVIYYEHTQFPKSEQDSFLICDWSMGRIMAVPLKKEGASYNSDFMTIISGNPLNVSDIEVDRDGSMVFCVGGRRTEGGLYRVTYGDEKHEAVSATTIEELIALPQITSAWAREDAVAVKTAAGEEAWNQKLVEYARKGSPAEQIRALTLLSQLGPKPELSLLIELAGSKNVMVRSFVTLLLGDHPDKQTYLALESLLRDTDPMVARRACEAYVRLNQVPPKEPLIKLLSSEDRHVRFAARRSLEMIPAEQWKKDILASTNPSERTYGLLALTNLNAIEPNVLMEQVLDLQKFGRGGMTNRTLLETLRLASLAMMAGAEGQPVEQLGQKLLELFPTNSPDANIELARLLSHLDVAEATPKLVEYLEAAADQETQIRLAMFLSYKRNGWTPDLQRQYLSWYEGTRSWEGGNSFVPYLANIVSSGISKYSPEDRKALLLEGVSRPFASSLILNTSKPEEIADFESVVTTILSDAEQSKGAGSEELVNVLISSLGKSEQPAIRETLRTIYENTPDRREQLARVIAEKPQAEDWEVLTRTLAFGDNTTLQLCLNALRKLEQKPEAAEPMRQAILAGQKLGDQGGLVAVELLQGWTGKPHGKDKDVAAALAFYRTIYAEQFPKAPSAEMQKVDVAEAGFSLKQLMDYLENDPQGQKGDVEKGKVAFEKAKCAKCHRFGNEGANVGPDLTSVRRRFQRKEIIESILLPSQVISDQFRMVTVITDDGLIHNGMPVPDNTKPDSLVLLLSDATKIEIPKDQLDEEIPSKTSVMPTGLLKDLTLQEIADMFAYIETSKFNEPTK